MSYNAHYYYGNSDVDLSTGVKEVAKNFVDWCKSFRMRTSGCSKGQKCAICHKSGTLMYFTASGVTICSETCYKVAQQRFQREQGNRRCKLPGCTKNCYVENNGTVHDFCSKSHAKEYENQKHQHYGILQCKLPGCSKPPFQEAGKLYEFCGKSHAEMYKRQFSQGSHAHYVPHQQRGSMIQYDQHQWLPTGHDRIHFYNKDEPFYDFTNFAPFYVEIGEKMWPTTEHYFQAQKFVGTPYEGVIQHLSSPREAFDFSRKPEVSFWRRNDWEQVKEDIMYRALVAKFTQYDQLCAQLISTGDSVLVEHTRNDKYWGDGGDGTGKNRLGELLMKLRGHLKRPKIVFQSTGTSAIPQRVCREQVQFSPPPSSPSPPKQSGKVYSPKDEPENKDLIVMEVDSSADSLAPTGNFNQPQDVKIDKLLRCQSQGPQSTGNTTSEVYTRSTSLSGSGISPTQLNAPLVAAGYPEPPSSGCNPKNSSSLVGIPSPFANSSGTSSQGYSDAFARKQPSLVGDTPSQVSSDTLKKPDQEEKMET